MPAEATPQAVDGQAADRATERLAAVKQRVLLAGERLGSRLAGVLVAKPARGEPPATAIDEPLMDDALTRGQRRKLGKAAEAEDAVQETFVSFVRGLRGFRAQASLETFLFSILRRKIIDLFTGEEGPVPDAADAMVTEIWQEHRLSCPKRSTIGSHLLGTLEPAWNDYVHFHLERLGCRFCRANLDDLREQTRSEALPALRHRILESTVGFLRP